MRLSPRLRVLLVAVSLTAIATAEAGCRKKTDAAASADGAESGITEENDQGSVSWTITSDGKAKGLVKGSDGKQVTKGITGKLTWKLAAGDNEVPASMDESAGLVIASGPALEDELTQVDYSLTIEGKVWLGTIHVPKGGTGALAEDNKAAQDEPIPDGKTGPNGGVVQIVGKDRVEVVADKATGQVRIYVLDRDFKPIEVGERRVRLGVVGESSEVVGLEREPGGLFFVGRMSGRVDPIRLTVAVSLGVETHACIVGWRPGVRLVVGARAPRVRLMAQVNWGPIPVSVGARGSVGVGASGAVGGSGAVVARGRDDDHDHGRGRGDDDDHGKGKKAHSDNGVRDHGRGDGRNGGGNKDKGGGGHGKGHGKGR